MRSLPGIVVIGTLALSGAAFAEPLVEPASDTAFERSPMVDGNPFVCQLCGHDSFKFGTGAKILGLYWLACAECGHVELFAQRPPLLDDAA